MRSVKLGNVYYFMLLELSKKVKKKPENYLADLLTKTYKSEIK